MILDFWATWCSPCRDLIPILGEIEGRYASKGVTVIGINLRQSKSVVERFVKSNDYDALILLDEDGRMAAKYAASSLPTLVIIDREGNVRQTIRGLYPDMRERIEKEIEPLL